MFRLQVRDIILRDDGTEKGGVAYKGETLADFIEQLENQKGTTGEYTLAEINEMLKECGIEPPCEHEIIIRLER